MPDESHDSRNTTGRALGGAIGKTIGKTIGGAVDLAVGTVENVGRLVGTALRLPGVRNVEARRHRSAPGSVPGIESLPDINTPPPPGAVKIRCIDYAKDRVEMTDIDDLEAFLAKPRPDWATVRWINVDGLHPWIVSRLRDAYSFHTLAAEDVLNVPQRPKVEPYDDELFIVTRMLMMHEQQVAAEQVSMFYRPDLLVTFQEAHGDIWQPIRERINTTGSRLRTNNAAYLLYALLDAIVDHCFPILEHFGDVLEGMEDLVVENPEPEMLANLHGIKRQLVLLRRVMWPMREVVAELQREDHKSINKSVRTFMRDVYDHVIQIIDIIETYREMGGSLTDLYMSAVSNRMNEIMKVLTIMASLFIPITFIAGVYGMNFDHMPELHWRYSYATIWGVFIAVTAALLYYFKRKRWI